MRTARSPALRAAALLQIHQRTRADILDTVFSLDEPMR